MHKWRAWLVAAAAGLSLAAPCAAQSTLDAATVAQVEALTRTSLAAPAGARVEIEVGQLDPRLRLAPCAKVQPYLPAGQRLWGRTRVGLRCTQGPVPWNVYLPITVHVWAQAAVAANPLPPGAELTAADVKLAEVDMAAAPGPVFQDPGVLVGRKLTVGVGPQAVLHAELLRSRQWFAAGDPVSIVVRGDGFAVSGEGQALSPGLEGQPVRVRTDSGRIVMGLPVAERRVEVPL